MVTGAAVIEPDEALALIADGADREALSPLYDAPLLIVHAAPGRAFRRFTRLARERPCVIVAVGAPGGPTPLGADMLVTTELHAPRPWVGGVDECGLARLAAAVALNPGAAVALAQLLRISAQLDPLDALVAESLTYGMLQSGPEHARWLGGLARRPREHCDEGPAYVVRCGSSLKITLARPRVRNAYNAAMRDQLVDALAVAACDPSIERVELRGAGPAFCSGGDLDEFGTRSDGVTAHLIRSTRNPAALLHAVASRTHAYLHGTCVGAGVELPAFAGTISARADASFRLPEVAMGLIPGAGGTVSVTRRIGRSRTAWLALSGATLDAITALRWGLVDELAEIDVAAG